LLETCLVTLVVFAGLPGVGKSALADRLAALLPAAIVSVDPVEAAIVRAGLAPSFETGLAAYLVAETVADANLAAGSAVVVDAVNAIDIARDMWRRLAHRHGAELQFVEVRLDDVGVHRDRLGSRQRGLAIPEPTWTDIERRRAEWEQWREDDPVLVVKSDAIPDVIARDLADRLRHTTG
jgi:predicted kinase